MSPRNILDELLKSKATAEEAEAFMDEVVLYIHEGNALTEEDCWPSKWLCLTRSEWSASGAGVPLVIIAEWRKNGWPEKCFKCGGTIVPENFGWMPKEVDGQFLLRHAVCPVPAVKQSP